MTTHKQAPQNADQPIRSGIRPILSFEQRTDHLRFAEKESLHRFPAGLANTTHWRRDRMIESWQAETEKASPDQREQTSDALEAIAYAVDAERFLGTFDRFGRERRLPAEAVDAIALSLISWLDARGFAVVRKEGRDG